jgi:hypothetical protein
MIERLLLHRIDTEARGASIRREHQPIVHPLAYEARAALTLVQPAIARAQIALNAAVIDNVPIARRVQRVFDGGGLVAHGSSESRYLTTV